MQAAQHRRLVLGEFGEDEHAGSTLLPQARVDQAMHDVDQNIDDGVDRRRSAG